MVNGVALSSNSIAVKAVSKRESRFTKNNVEMNNVCNENTSVPLNQHNDSTLGNESQQKHFMYGYRESLSAEDGGFTSENRESKEIKFRKKGGNHDTSGEDDASEFLSRLLIAEGGLEDGVEDWDRVQTVMRRARNGYVSTPNIAKNFKTYVLVAIACLKAKKKQARKTLNCQSVENVK